MVLMVERRVKVLLVERPGAAGLPLADILTATAEFFGLTVERAGDDTAAVRDVEWVRPDIILVDAEAAGMAIIPSLEALRNAAGNRPIVVLTEVMTEGFLSAAYQAGARECLPRQDALVPPVVRVIHEVVERPHASPASADAKESDVASAEFGRLHALCGPAPLPVTARNFGMRSLPDKLPEDFQSLIAVYGQLLDLALDRAALKDAETFERGVEALVERLGLLNAGPRDVIELHKAGIAAKLSGPSTAKAKAYVEEGRFLMLKLMGDLVSLYRALSWGRAPGRRAGLVAADTVANPAAQKKDPSA